MRKIFHVVVLITVTLLAGCGGGGGSSGGGGGGIGGGSCTNVLTPYVDASECWEYSSNESNGIAHCAAVSGAYSMSACDETGKVATCTTLFPPGSLTGNLFTVYWFSGSPVDFTAECVGTLSGSLTTP